MTKKDQGLVETKLFSKQEIRTIWDETEEQWYFSVIDVIRVLTGSQRPRKYWDDLKRRLTNNDGSQLSEKIGQVKLQSSDGKYYSTDVANTEQLLRLIQSIPSPKVEPLKLWLAEVGKDRLEEAIDPELTINRALKSYLHKGYSQTWVNQRLKSIEVRKDLADEWEKRGVRKGQEFATLTDIISQTWSGFTTREYKNHKKLYKENLRDNMTNLELVLTMLAEASTTEISQKDEPSNWTDNRAAAQKGGKVAQVARKQLENTTGERVVTSQNNLVLKKLK